MIKRFSQYPGRIGAVLILLIFLSGCASVVPVTETVRFTLLGNTLPDSPFAGFTKAFPEFLHEIESYKTQIIVHTGNAIYGGSEKDGILETDITRQLDIFSRSLKKLHTAVYTMPGERDYYNESSRLFLKFSGKKPGYSFNYGSIHFISLSSSGSGDFFIDEKQLEWLKKDLEESSGSTAVFILAHHQLFPDRKKIKIPEQNEEIHRLFLNYPVKAVFSGYGKEYSSKQKDSIKYINAGCTGNTEKKYNKKGYRFYIINFSKNEITVDPVK